MLVNTTSAALIRLSGEIVAIANHPGAVSQSWFDDRFYQLNARGIKHQNFGFIGYKTGENKYSYPKFGRAKAEELLGELCRLADYVIVDCTSNLDDSIIAQTAIEKAEQIIRLSSPDLKSISFYLSQLPCMSDSKYRLDEHIQGINTPNADVFMPIEEAKALLGEVSFTVPFSPSVKEQMQQGKLFERTSDKRFESRMRDIAGQVVAYGTD